MKITYSYNNNLYYWIAMVLFIFVCFVHGYDCYCIKQDNIKQAEYIQQLEKENDSLEENYKKLETKVLSIEKQYGDSLNSLQTELDNLPK